MNRIFIFIAAATTTFVITSLASTSIKRKAPCNKAKNEISRLKRVAPAVWVEALYDSYLQYQSCDNGEISVAYDQTITFLLIKNKRHTAKLTSYAKKDPNFGSFVFSHVLSEKNSERDLATVREVLNQTLRPNDSK